MDAVLKTAQKNADVLKTLKLLKLHIGMELSDTETEDKSFDIQIWIAEIDAEFDVMMHEISAENTENFDEWRVNELMMEKAILQ